MPCYKWNSFSGGDSIVKKIDARRPAGDASFLRPIRVAGAGPCGDGPLRQASGGCSDVTGAVHDSRDANDAPTRWKMRSRPCGSSGTRRHRCVADAAAGACRAVAAALAGSLRDRRLATRGKFSPGHDCLRGPAGRATGSNTCPQRPAGSWPVIGAAFGRRRFPWWWSAMPRWGCWRRFWARNATGGSPSPVARRWHALTLRKSDPFALTRMDPL